MASWRGSSLIRSTANRNNWLGWFNKVSKSIAWICFHTLGKYSLIMRVWGRRKTAISSISSEAQKKMKPSDDSGACSVFICSHPWREIKWKLPLHVLLPLFLLFCGLQIASFQRSPPKAQVHGTWC